MTNNGPFGDTFTAGAAPFDEAYAAAREAVAAFDRTDRCRIAVSGADRESFLSNMLSNDVRRLAPGSGIEATFLTNKGKLVAALIVYEEPERFLLELDRERVDPLAAALDRYVISEDVKLAKQGDEEARFSLEGPKASTLLEALTGAAAADLEGLRDLEFESVAVEDVPLVVIAKRGEPSFRFDVIVPRKHAASVLSRALAGGAVPASDDVAETRRLEAGRPRFGLDMDDSHLPLEAGLDRAISFEKGCYIGQEYVVRLAHRGHLNRKLLGLKVAGEPAPPRGSRVVLDASGAEVGEVTSARYSPAAGASLALAYLRREAFEPGTKVTVVAESERRDGTVSSLPFIAPSS